MGNLSPLRLTAGSGGAAPLILAPLEGITTAPYRRVLFRRYGGFDGAVAPFIGTIRNCRKYDYHLRDILPEANSGRVPLIPQILGADREGIEEVARACAALGYPQVNWNIGCPIRNVVRKRRGAGILPHPGMVGAVLSRLCRPELPAYSVKLRLGLESAEEWRALLPLFNGADLDFLVLHPRTGLQMYGGAVRREAFAEFLRESRHPVVWSGDILSRADHAAAAECFPAVSGWMLGRGLLRRPVLAAEIRTARDIAFGPAEMAAFLLELRSEFLAEGHAATWLLGKLKQHLAYLRRGCDTPEEADRLWRGLRPLESLSAAEELLAAAG